MLMKREGLVGVAVAVVMVLAVSAQAVPTVNLVDLGAMSGLGGVSATAYGVNAKGDVVGSYTTSTGVEKGFLYHDANGNRTIETGERKNLGTLGGAGSCGNSINDAGQVTGWANVTGSTEQTAFIWRDANSDWIVQGTEMSSLGTLGGSMTRGMSINNAGQVAGLGTIASGSIRAFRWTDTNGNWKGDAGEMVNLGTLGGASSRAFGINNAGHVAGYSDDASAQQTYKWVDSNSNNAVDPSELIKVVSLATPSFGYDVNDAGQIGGFFIAGDGQNHAFFSDGTTMIDINTVLGATWSKAYSISESGLVCGAFAKGGVTHGFIYVSDSGTAFDVNSFMTGPAGFVVTSVRDIADMSTGEAALVGYGTASNGETHAFIAYGSGDTQQTPEPVTMILVGTGAMFLFGRARRKVC